jgi:hypothetical protein
MQAIVNPVKRQTLSFWWSVSSEKNHDLLQFYIDGVLRDKISGNVNWQQKNYVINAGKHTVKWVYMKNGAVSTGADAGYVDTVQIR